MVGTRADRLKENFDRTVLERQLAAMNEQVLANAIATALAAALPAILPAPVAQRTVEYSTNPYCANIHPLENVGSRLFRTATEPLDKAEKVFPNMDNAKQFLKMMQDDSETFGWGVISNNIKRYDDAGDAIKVGGTDVKHNLLEDFKSAKLTVDDIRTYTAGFYMKGNDLVDVRKNKSFPTHLTASAIDPDTDANDKKMFYNQVRLNMIGQRVKGSLTPRAVTQLYNKRSQFAWKLPDGVDSLDGLTMLMILISEIKPTTRVGVSNLKDKIRATRLSHHNYNVKETCEHISNLYCEILLNDGTHEDIQKDLFAALTSGKNEEFQAFIETKKSAWEMGEDMTADDISTEAITKYNNLVQQNKWKQTEKKDAKMAALSTEIEQLKTVLATVTNGTSNSSSHRNDSGSGRNNNRQVADWRKKKSFGAQTERDGKTWYWCPKHEGKGYNGLYVSHKPEDHDAHMAKFKRGPNENSNGNNNRSSSQSKLFMKDSLKTAMVTKFGLSTADAEKFWTDMSEN